MYVHGTPSSLVHCCGLATLTQLYLEKHGSRRSEASSVTHFRVVLASLSAHGTPGLAVKAQAADSRQVVR